MDFFAFVTTARWPAIFVSSSAAASTSFAFEIASPMPMFRTTFSIFGTAIGFSMPNSFLRTGMTSFLYFSEDARSWLTPPPPESVPIVAPLFLA